jgi:hypothetical protein
MTLLLPLRIAVAASIAFPVMSQTVRLVVPLGTPLEVTIDRKVPIGRVGEPVGAHLLRGIYVFDREVIPAGSRVTGHVARLDPVRKQRRINSMMNGDFTPFKDPQIEFDEVILPDGRPIAMKTTMKLGKGTIIRSQSMVRMAEDPEKTAQQSKTARALGFVRSEFDGARDQIVTTMKSPDKWDLLQQNLYSYLPYHPQFIPAHTSIITELVEPLDFGSESQLTGKLAKVGAPPADSLLTVRVLSPINSKTSAGTPIEAVTLKPLYSADHELLLPEGTHLTGAVVSSQPARMWRRGGALRFTFQSIRLPDSINTAQHSYPIQAVVAGLDVMGPVNMRVDSEGVVSSVEPMSRFIAPAVKMFIGMQMLDQDSISSGQSAAAKRTWRMIAGASGYGVAGSVAAQASKQVATSLSFYGLAWSVFTHVVSRGHEVRVGEGTPVVVRIESSPASRPGQPKLTAGPIQPLPSPTLN